MGGCCLEIGIRYPETESELSRPIAKKRKNLIGIGYNGTGMLVPDTWQGPSHKIPFTQYQWIKAIPGKVWCRLFETAPSLHNDFTLPKGYDVYIASFHLEPIDIKWVEIVSETLDGPLVVLGDTTRIKYPAADNVLIKSYYYWHRQLEQAMAWYPDIKISKNIAYKASAICNRVTQSKMLITTALLEELADDCLIRLSNWIEAKNIHFNQPTNNKTLDTLADVFSRKYAGKELCIDDFQNGTDNYQKHTINPMANYLHRAAINFTNETLAYSLMQENSKEFIYPGPFLTEKTLKCLLSNTGFVPVGQYDTYGSLQRLGLQFDYPFDTSWDQDPGNLTRLESIVKLVKWFRDYTAQEIYDMVAPSTAHNFDAVWSGKFSQKCEIENEKTVQEILDRFG